MTKLKISDIIEGFICDMLDDASTVELKRNELAEHFNCVPSQINYVISTRFTTERGYIVESRRGGGGHIKITRVELDGNERITHGINNIGSSLDVLTLDSIINTLYANNIINITEAQLIKAACSNNSLAPAGDNNTKNKLRANIFKNMLLLFV